ncbi:MAG TPA: GTPase Era [Bacteroidota bacterium]|nr:GTPase Era [Bacteroidota bacterium]
MEVRHRFRETTTSITRYSSVPDSDAGTLFVSYHMSEQPTPFRAGYVAIVGEPNVGKSTLLNGLLKQKISIVTSKPQTTRQKVLGILTQENYQIVFFDTPGLLRPKYLLHEKMIQSALSALQDADVVLVMTEVGKGTDLPAAVNEYVLKKQSGTNRQPLILVLNKVDTIERSQVLPMIATFDALKVFDEIVPISALKAENLDDLLQTIVRYLPEGPQFYPPDIVSEHPERFFVAEFIREKIFDSFRDEIPYSTAVEITEFKEREKGKTYIAADIIVERDSQKGILIGAGGSALKKVGEQARQQIEEFLQKPVFLELHVKVREKWRRSEQWMKRLGYTSE